MHISSPCFSSPPTRIQALRLWQPPCKNKVSITMKSICHSSSPQMSPGSTNLCLLEDHNHQTHHQSPPSQLSRDSTLEQVLETVAIDTHQPGHSPRHPLRTRRYRTSPRLTRVAPYQAPRSWSKRHGSGTTASISGHLKPTCSKDKCAPEADVAGYLAESSRKQSSTLEQVNSFWERYNKMSEFEDKEFVKDLGASLDVLLIFAGLFSAVNAAFIIEATRSLQPDRAERTNALIQTVILTLQNSSSAETDPNFESSHPSPRAIRSNAFFFASLCSSLAAAFGAVLGKQWLRHYEHEGNIKPSATRGRERQRKYEGRNRWHLEGVIETLPVILQVSVFLFLFALTDFLWPISPPSAWVAISFIIATFLLYGLTTIIAISDSNSPFQTTISILLRRIEPLRTIGRSWINLRSQVSHTKRRLRYISRNGDLKAWPRLFYKSLSELHSRISSQLERLNHTLRGQQPDALSFQTMIRDPPKAAEVELTSLGCVVFAIKRISSPQDIQAVLDAMAALPLRPQIDRSDPVVELLAESLFDFLIKPSIGGSKFTAWGNVRIDYQPLLKILFSLFVHWDYLRDHPAPGISAEWSNDDIAEYTHQLFQYLQKEMWKVFCRKPHDVGSVKLIADVILRIGEYRGCSQPEMDLFLASFTTARQDPVDRLPYLSLLFGEIYLDAQPAYPTRQVMASEGVRDALLSTMWISGNADLDSYRGRLRVEWLPTLISGDILEQNRFSSYLLQWLMTRVRFRRNSSNTQAGTVDDSIQALKSYLKAVYRLLKTQSYPIDKLWTQADQATDHASCLILIVRGELDLPVPGLFDLHSEYEGRSNALYCLIMLWRRHWTTATEAERSTYMHRQPSPIAAVVKCLDPTHFQDLAHSFDLFGTSTRATRLPVMMDHLVQFLEEASHLQLLVHGMESVVVGYRLWGDWILQPDQCRPFYERADKLVFY